jgi:hypothetical protein
MARNDWHKEARKDKQRRRDEKIQENRDKKKFQQGSWGKKK